MGCFAFVDQIRKVGTCKLALERPGIEIFAQALFQRYTRRLFRIWSGEDFFVHSKRLGTFF